MNVKSLYLVPLLAAVTVAVFVLLIDVAYASTRYCTDPVILSNGTQICPPPLRMDSSVSQCCADLNRPIYPGQRPGVDRRGRRRGRRGRRRLYCGPYLLVNNKPECPPTHPYDSVRDKCCGRRPIDGPSRDDRREGCVDKHAPGRASDCAANAVKCNDPLWRDLMTDQCPKTCHRCGERVGYYYDTVTGRRSGACVDGVGPNGVSDCPRNVALCNHPNYSAFMRAECPATCGICGLDRTYAYTYTYTRRGRRRGGRRRRLRDPRRRRGLTRRRRRLP